MISFLNKFKKEFKEEIMVIFKDLFAKLENFVHRNILTFLVGMLFGLFLGYSIYVWQTNQIVRVGGFVFNNVVYNVTKR
jgi:hypothetical protein